jgi:Zn-dependent metalloprotease
MCLKSQRRPVLCILPPHILRSIAERGTPEQRASASRTLALDATLRALRASPISLEGPPAIAIATDAVSKRRTIYTANHQQQLPGTIIASEAHPPAANADVAVREAFHGLGATWDFYADMFDRHSIDDEGMALDATVHYGDRYNNAFWNSRQMVFGDGDGQLFNRFTIAVDVIGHELTHGVTEDEAGLVYMFQAGALNESLSDVFGSLIKQKLLKQTSQQADWLIGEGLFTAAVNGRALRSMKAPGTAYADPVLGRDPQPDHMSKYVNTYNDNGGVHINSGIPNKAFQLAAAALGGYAWEKAGRIWYETLRDSALRPDTGFKRFAKLTVSTAGLLYGQGSVEQDIVADAWATVGLPVSVGVAAFG